MLLKRNNSISCDRGWFYRFNDHKQICFDLNADRSIRSIGLLDSNKGHYDPEEWHNIDCLCYIEQITLDDGELLNVDALMALARREDNA